MKKKKWEESMSTLKEMIMSASVLVAYATRYGSTQEVAEAVAKTLRERGLEADLQPMRKVGTLEGYRAVVLGAPLYIGLWHRDAHRFLSRHRQALAQQRLAIFALGPTQGSSAEKEWQDSRGMLDKELAKFPSLAPVACRMFGGRYDPAKLRFPDSLIAGLPASPLHQTPASDLRDWRAIRAWAADLAAELQPALPK